MTDFQSVSERGETITNFSRSDYVTWVRTWARCANCGKRRMDIAGYYGLAPMEQWVTETNCGCTLPRWDSYD